MTEAEVQERLQIANATVEAFKVGVKHFDKMAPLVGGEAASVFSTCMARTHFDSLISSMRAQIAPSESAQTTVVHLQGEDSFDASELIADIDEILEKSTLLQRNP